MASLRTEKLSIEIGGKQVCHQLDLDLQPGQVWGVLGRNGVGKTTLLHSLAGLRAVSAGKVLLDQQNMAQLPRKTIAQKLGLLLQHTEDVFPASVLETVVTGRHPHIANWQWESAADYSKAEHALEQVAMTALAQRQVNTLSGGERQRVAIATLLTQDPDIYLLDEPNSHLDLHYQISILDKLCEFARQQQRIVLMSLHDINLAARFCDHLLFISGDGKSLAGSADKLLNSNDLSDLFQHPIHTVQTADGVLFTPA
ncbi:MAG: ABC transporter ATP-binding protein [Gammaproteobacteria bacterium]|nr:ABC transporter ATP-binding protein [Gammaproteobacteria bacterium]